MSKDDIIVIIGSWLVTLAICLRDDPEIVPVADAHGRGPWRLLVENAHIIGGTPCAESDCSALNGGAQ